jgi:RND superfamily putative drug exporter
MYRYRAAVLAGWLVLFAIFAFLAGQTPGLLKNNGFAPEGSEADRAIQLLQQQMDFPSSSLKLVYTSESLDLTQAVARQTILDSLQEIREFPEVGDIEFAAESPLGGRVDLTMVTVGLRLNSDEALDRYPDLKKLINAPNGMKVYVTGGTAILYDMSQASKTDIAKSEIIGLPIALIVLLAVFGTVLGALLPLIVGMVSVTITLGLLYFVALDVPLSNFLPNIVTMLGLAVGIDYALFMVSRFREELKRGGDVRDAVAMASQTAGKSIFFSGIAVLIGMGGMLFVPLNFFESLCLGGVSVVAVSVLVANTLLPALFSIFGHKVNAWKVFPESLRKLGGGASWEKIAWFVMRRPVRLVVITCLVLVAAMLPLFDMRLGVPDAEVLPPSYESRHGSDLLKAAYDQRESGAVQIVVQSGGSLWDEGTIRQLLDLQDRLAGFAGVERVRSYLDVASSLGGTGVASDPGRIAALLSQGAVREKIGSVKLADADGHTAIISVVPKANPDSREARQLVKNLRAFGSEWNGGGVDGGNGGSSGAGSGGGVGGSSDVAGSGSGSSSGSGSGGAVYRPAGLHLLVAGETAYRYDIEKLITDSLPAVLGFVMGITYLVLLFAFRSVVLPLKAVLMNVLSLGASLGLVVCVFQYGYLADAFAVSAVGYVSATVPVLIFCVVFGISMDYEVFLITRIMEEYEASGDNEHSTAAGLMRTGGLITSAAFILVVVVGSFIFTDIEIIKALGLGLALAILIDATIIRIAVVPALMKLLGRANWWAPAWMRPIRTGPSSQVAGAGSADKGRKE